MNIKKLRPIISAVSVLIMFIWGYLEGSFEHSWLAVFVGGIVVAAISVMGKNEDEKDSDEKDEDDKDKDAKDE